MTNPPTTPSAASDDTDGLAHRYSRKWREMLARHHAAMRQSLSRIPGNREDKTKE